MVEIKINENTKQLIVKANIFLYGKNANEEIRSRCEKEINDMWNAPMALVWKANYPYLVQFNIDVFLEKDIDKIMILENTNPKNNFIRVEEFAYGNISFVDGLGSNSGYFKLENLYEGSTTMAHEFGHLMGLPHPLNCDIRGEGEPGIMYPRGTLVDAKYQYDETIKAGKPGGTMHPKFRIVTQKDIDELHLEIFFNSTKNYIGFFSNKYHEAHLNNEASTFV